MKYTRILFIALLLSGCGYFYNHIEFTGLTPGINNGMVLIKDMAGKSVFGATIKAGKFTIRKQTLTAPGYYTLSITNNDVVKKRGALADEFEIYLEPGDYTIATGRKGLSNYPIITTSSKIQNELSDYYPLADSIKSSIHTSVSGLLDEMNSPDAQKLSKADYMLLVDKVKAAQTKEAEATSGVLGAYLTKYPKSEVVAHLMAATNYDSDPVASYKLYQKFSAAAKNSDDGQEIGDKLSHLVKMLPGAPVPQFVGETPDGKTVDIKALHKKIILVEFWRAGIIVCRKHHQQLISGILPNLSGKGFGVVSVSLDEKRDWWTGAVKDDKMTWPQVSDGKGLDSQNADNWGITDVPTYCLVDGNGRLIERNVSFDNVMFSVTDYLGKH